MSRTPLLSAVCFTLLISGVQAQQTTFFDKLSGRWSGSGQTYVSKYGDISVNCRVDITGTTRKIAMRGSCGKLLVRQELGISIRNVGGNKFVGTYTGSKTGPAKLEGTLRGDRLVMNISWGGIVNGDRTAQMVFIRTGPNSFAQTVNDNVAGKNRTTSSLRFNRL